MHSHQRVLTRFNSIEPLSENIARCFKLTLSVLLAPVPSWLGSDGSALCRVTVCIDFIDLLTWSVSAPNVCFSASFF